MRMIYKLSAFGPSAVVSASGTKTPAGRWISSRFLNFGLRLTASNSQASSLLPKSLPHEASHSESAN